MKIIDIKEIPGYDGLKFVRIIPALIKDPLKKLTGIVESGGKIIPFRLGKYHLYLINDESLLRHILKKNYENYPRGESLEGIKPLLGNGLFTSNNEYWVNQQKKIGSAFRSKYIESFFPVIEEETKTFSHTLDTASESNGEVELQDSVKEMMLRILIRTMFAKNLEFDGKRIIKELDFVLDYTSIKGAMVRRLFGFPLKLSGIAKREENRYNQALEYLNNFAYKIIDDSTAGKLETTGLLEILTEDIKSGAISRIQMRDEIMTFLFAGFDTVAEGIIWFWYLLSQNKDYLEEVRNEVERLGIPGNLESIQKYKKLTNGIKESLRLYPPAWAFYRIAEKEDIADEFKIFKKAYLMISPYLMHRLSKYYNAPEKFYPERFDEESNPEFSRFDYIPFGQGPHICTGKRLASTEIALISALILSKYDFEYSSEIPPKITPGIIIKSKTPLLFKVKRITE